MLNSLIDITFNKNGFYIFLKASKKVTNKGREKLFRPKVLYQKVLRKVIPTIISLSILFSR